METHALFNQIICCISRIDWFWRWRCGFTYTKICGCGCTYCILQCCCRRSNCHLDRSCKCLENITDARRGFHQRECYTITSCKGESLDLWISRAVTRVIFACLWTELVKPRAAACVGAWTPFRTDEWLVWKIWFFYVTLRRGHVL
jgi:hypothetical protein